MNCNHPILLYNATLNIQYTTRCYICIFNFKILHYPYVTNNNKQIKWYSNCFVFIINSWFVKFRLHKELSIRLVLNERQFISNLKFEPLWMKAWNVWKWEAKRKKTRKSLRFILMTIILYCWYCRIFWWIFHSFFLFFFHISRFKHGFDGVYWMKESSMVVSKCFPYLMWFVLLLSSFFFVHFLHYSFFTLLQFLFFLFWTRNYQLRR